MSNFAYDQFMMLGAEAVATAVLLLFLFRIRTRLGLSPLYVTLGVFQPIQVLLASSIYVEMLPGITVSPGSIIMFTATLFAILLVYIREDAIEARKIIYGIVIANFSMTLLLLIFSVHLDLQGTHNFLKLPHEIFNQGTRVMITGTVVLFIDVILLVFIYEAMWRFFKRSLFIRIYSTMVIILSFDTLAFVTGAFFGQPFYSTVLVSGLIGKGVMAVFFAAALTIYLRSETENAERIASGRPYRDIFYALTYREKYELERLYSEEVIRNSNARFGAAEKMARLGSWEQNVKTGKSVWSDELFRICGYEPGAVEPTAEKGFSIIHPDYRESARQHFIEAVEKRRTYNTDMKIVRPSGEVRWVNVLGEAVFDDKGELTKLVGAVLDITERKKTEEEITTAHAEILTMNSIIHACSSTLKINEILDKVLEEALNISGLEGGTICMVTPDETLELAAHRATSEATIIDLTTNEVKVGDCLCGECARDHKPLILPDREAVLKYSTREATRGEDIRFHAAFPIIIGVSCLGVLCVFTRTDKKPTDRSLKLIETITAQIALAMRNAQLHEETLQHTVDLEETVKKRTSDLENKNRDLEHLNQLFVDREFRIKELKERVKELERRQNSEVRSQNKKDEK